MNPDVGVDSVQGARSPSKAGLVAPPKVAYLPTLVEEHVMPRRACPECNLFYSISARECPGCGAPGWHLAPCSDCDQQIPVESISCPECGVPESPIPAHHALVVTTILSIEERIRQMWKAIDDKQGREADPFFEYQLVRIKQRNSSADAVLRLRELEQDLADRLE